MESDRPFDVQRLPEPLRPVVLQALDKGRYDEAIEEVEVWLEGGGERVPEVLVAQAWMLYLDAVTIMVDEVAPRGERALELIKEARKGGVPVDQIKALRDEIKKAVGKVRRKEKRLLAKLDKVQTLSRRELSDLAYVLADMPGPELKLRSAECFELLEQRFGENRWYRYTGAIVRARAGELEGAWPVIRELTEEPPDAWLLANTHFIHRGWQVRVDLADDAAFAGLFGQAREATASLEGGFPLAEPFQDAWLRRAMDLGEVGVVLALLPLVKKRRKAPARALAAEASAWLEQRGES